MKHISRQGVGTKRKRKSQQKVKAEDIILKGVPCKSDHHGMNVLLHDWILLAHRRRSFKLLSSAASLACMMNISMDDIMSKKTGLARFEKVRKIMPKILDVEQSSQCVVKDMTDFLLTNDLLYALGLNSMEFKKRIVWIRHCNSGKAGFWASPAFENLTGVSSELMTKTFKENKKTVKSLYLDEKGCRDQLRALNRALANIEKPGTTKKTSSRTQIKDVKTNSMIDTKFTMVVYTPTIYSLIVVGMYELVDLKPVSLTSPLNISPAFFETSTNATPAMTTTTTTNTEYDIDFDDGDLADFLDAWFEENTIEESV